MKKSILIKFLIIIMSVFAALGVTACEEHTHTYSSEWSYDDTHHFKKATCEHSNEFIDKQAHTMNGNSCTECDYRTLSVGLEYKLNINGESYSVIGKGECNDTNIVIPSTYKGKPITSIGEDAFSRCTSLTSIEIPNSVTSIGDYAFNNCDSLTSIEIPNSVTSIGYSAFRDCTSLISVTIGNGVTSIGGVAFGSCSSLTSIEIPNSVTSIESSAFSYCENLTSITIPNSVTSIGMHAFYYCSSLTIYCEVNSKPNGWNSDWNYSNCPVVWNCNNNDVATDGYIYTVIDGIRYGIKDGVATVVKQPRNITSANILSTVTYKGVTYNVTSIGEDAFYNCRSLTSITIPNSVTIIGDGAFFHCTSLTSIEVDGNNTVYSSLDGNLYNKNKTTLIQYAIGKQATSFTIPNSVTSIGNSAFYNCTSLTSIEIPNSVTSIGRSAFSSCTTLTRVTIGSGVTSIGIWAFYNCTSLTSIEIPNSVTSIGDRAFAYCGKLTIYCEATSKPNGWDSNWNYSSGPVYWYSEIEPTTSGNYWHYVNGVATKW